MQGNHLSPHLYILASMNEADTSVEPLDIAFLRRFSVYRLYPDVTMLYGYLNVTHATETPGTPTTKEHVLSALVKAWSKANERISIGKSEAFQVGHGIFVTPVLPSDLPQSLEYAATIWRKIETHAAELFYGDDLSLSNVFNAQTEGVYSIKDVEFADQVFSKFKISNWNSTDIYNMLIQIVNEAPTQ
jgi:5-methylcytosine-specific restriction protein B